MDNLVKKSSQKIAMICIFSIIKNINKSCVVRQYGMICRNEEGMTAME